LTSNDSPEYLKKKQLLKQIITIYGRKPVLEILSDKNINIYCLHLAESNKQQGIINDIISLAQQRDIEIKYHQRQQLSHISKNSKQDQGVCIDVLCPKHADLEAFLRSSSQSTSPIRLIALDRITNPQNLGMIIRSVCAGAIDGLIIPEKGCAKIDSLVIKASAGTVFKAPILRSPSLSTALVESRRNGASLYGLSSHATVSISQAFNDPFIVYILGNETEGMSKEVSQMCDELISIPMNNHVESLNVAVTASLLAFKEVMN